MGVREARRVLQETARQGCATEQIARKPSDGESHTGWQGSWDPVADAAPAARLGLQRDWCGYRGLHIFRTGRQRLRIKRFHIII